MTDGSQREGAEQGYLRFMTGISIIPCFAAAARLFGFAQSRPWGTPARGICKMRAVVLKAGFSTHEKALACFFISLEMTVILVLSIGNF
jgi:hypothetical protein